MKRAHNAKGWLRDCRSKPILVEDHCSQGFLGFGIVQTAFKMIDRPNNWSVGRNDDNDGGCMMIRTTMMIAGACEGGMTTMMTGYMMSR